MDDIERFHLDVKPTGQFQPDLIWISGITWFTQFSDFGIKWKNKPNKVRKRQRNSLDYTLRNKIQKIIFYKDEQDDGSEKAKQKLSQALPMNSMSKRRTEAGGIRHEPA